MITGMENILYVFSGEKAQGAEIVIERLMVYNASKINAHLFIAPGDFACQLLQADKPYKITTVPELRRLFRSKTNGFSFYLKAIANHFKVSYKVYRCLKKDGIEIVHANNILAASNLLPVILYSKLFLRKIVWVWSDHDMGYTAGIDRLIAKLAVRLYDRTMAVSSAVSKKYEHNKKVQVLYNGLDTTLFKPNDQLRTEFRANLELQGNTVLLGMAGKVTPGKGHLVLIQVFNELTRRFPNIYLVLAGGYAEDTPDYSEKVEKAIAANPRIKHLGFLQDMVSFYNGCDIMISNSDKKMSESLGTTIYEAMAFEKIVVASDTGGTPEIITDLVDGFLFPAEQQFELLAKLDDIISNYPVYGNIKKRAREKVNQQFNILKMKADYNQILNSIHVGRA